MKDSIGLSIAAAILQGATHAPLTHRDDSPRLAEKYCKLRNDPEQGRKAAQRMELRRIKRERNNFKSSERQYPGHAIHQTGQGLST